jgi:hypothetical protein
MRIHSTVCVSATLWPTRKSVSQTSMSVYEPGSPSEPRVAVEVGRADAGPGDQRLRVVLLGEQLAGGVEAEGERARLREHLPGPIDEELHRLVPRGRRELAVATDERPRQPVRRVVRPPAVQSLRPEPAVVDAVVRPPADADDPAVCDGDVETAAVRAEHARRRHPLLDLGLVHVELDVVPLRPGPFGGEGRPRTPDVGDGVAHE